MTYHLFLDTIMKAGVYWMGPVDGEYLAIRWVIGGEAVGDFWEVDAHSTVVVPEPKPEWTELDRVLDACAPNLTYRQYRELTTLIKHEHNSQDGYDGNRTQYALKRIRLRELFSFLERHGLVA